MIWYICMAIAVALFLSAFLYGMAVKKEKVKRGPLPFTVLFCAFFISATALFFPAYLHMIPQQYVKSFILSMHNTIRLFVVDGEFNFILEHIEEIPLALKEAYSLLMALLFLIAPCLTFGFIWRFIQQRTTAWKYARGTGKDTYVFSELNEDSLTLGTDLLQKDSSRMVIYTDFFESNEERGFFLMQEAKKIGALCFKNDITDMDFSRLKPGKRLCFFLLGADDQENKQQALALSETYKKREATSVYLFSHSDSSALMLGALEIEQVKVRRVNVVRSLVYRTMHKMGHQLFAQAYEANGQKHITAIVVGLGNHGVEILKILPWLCQMDGYTISVHGFDRTVGAAEKFQVECPDLLNPLYNHQTIDGEAQYHLEIQDGFLEQDFRLLRTISAIEHPTYIFVDLGDDETNVQMSVRLREQFLKQQEKPIIQTLIEHPDLSKNLNHAVNHAGQAYEIQTIGSRQQVYSERVILQTALEKEALMRHKMYCQDEKKVEDFWKYEYNYHSSMATVLHKYMVDYCQIPGSDKAIDQRTEAEQINLQRLEHVRWNAYMRSEGYTYGTTRYDLAKVHPNLVPFAQLTQQEHQKDTV